jgi:hypothetical protein
MNTEVFYHGTHRLFDKFSLNFLGEGEGDNKFGKGIYITSNYRTAALYASKAAKRGGTDKYYVYTVEVPLLAEANHLYSNSAVNKDIVALVEKEIGEAIPNEAKEKGKYLRKYVGNLLDHKLNSPDKKRKTIKQMTEKASPATELLASAFFRELGLTFYVWPQAQTKPNGVTNRIVLDTKDIKILKIEQVECDNSNELIKGSEKEVKL